MNPVVAEQRTRLEEALTLISAQRARYGDATVDTAVAVLEEQLAGLPEPAADRAVEVQDPPDERKQVTILFASIEGFTRLAATMRNTERLRKIDLLWRRLDQTIHDHGGVVDKHMGDVVMGIFGASVAREDDPERAVRCALALREVAGGFLAAAERDAGQTTDATAEPVIRIGINTGQVLLGQVGSDSGRTAIGDAVNVASRLKETRADTGIYISQDTYRLVRNLFRFEPLGEIIVKGRRTPVGVFRVVGSRPRLFFPGDEGVGGIHAPMVGREREMSILEKALSDAAEERHGGLVLVIGDAGVGKSRLAAELHRRLEMSPVEVTIFQARSSRRLAQVSYSLLRDLLISHFDIDENDRPAVIKDKIARRFVAAFPVERLAGDPKARKRAHAIIQLVGLGAAEGRYLERDETKLAAERERAIPILLEYLDAVAHRSAITLFLLEDIHWIDEDSMAFLERLSATAADAPWLMVGMARPEFIDRWPNWPGNDAVTTTRIMLRPLTESKCRELVLNILRKLPYVPPELPTLVVQSAAGNPFYVEELIRVLIEDGVIVPHEKHWLLRPRELTHLRVPATLTGVLQSRLDRLPEVERIILQQAAVVGDEFWAGAVQRINAASRHPYSEDQVESALQSLERRDMIYRAPAPAAAGGHAYLFKHAMLREVAYEGVLLRDRPGYHLQAAHWLETWSGDWLADYAAPIAQHLEQGGRPADAARLYELAAVRALDQYKVPGAIQHFHKVLELLRDMPQLLDTRLAIRQRLGNALQRQGRMVEALENYRVMHKLAELDGNILGRAWALNGQATVFYEQGENARALEAATEAAQLARLTGADLEWVRATLLQGEAAARLGRTHEASAAAALAVERARALDVPLEVARGLALLASLPSAMAQPQVARDAMAELTALTDELTGDKQRTDERDATLVLSRIGDLVLAQGRSAESVDYFDRALALARSAGDPSLVAEILRRLGLATCRMGDAPSALAYLEEAAGLAETTGNRYLRLGCRLSMAEALLVLGHHSAAEATLRQVIAAAEDRQRLGSWRELPHAYRLLGEIAENKTPGAWEAPGVRE